MLRDGISRVQAGSDVVTGTMRRRGCETVLIRIKAVA